MISFVEENVQKDSVFESLTPYDYNGYSIMESALDTINFITESFSDIQMSTLLNEYKYLYENGEEIVYEDDETAAEGKKTGKIGAVVDKIVAAIKNWGERLLGMLQNAVSKVQAIATSVTTKAGISKKAFDAVPEAKIVQYARMATRFKKDPTTITAASELIDNWDGEIPSKDARAIVADYYDKDASKDGAAPSYYSKASVGAAVFGGYKNIGKKILDARKEVTKIMNGKLKEAKKAKSENMAEIMSKYSAAMKYNTAVVSGLLKVYAEYAKECRNIVVRSIGTHKSDEKYNKDLDAANAKETKEERTAAKAEARENREGREAEDKAKFTEKSAKNTRSFARAAMTKQELKDDNKATREKAVADTKNKVAAAKTAAKEAPGKVKAKFADKKKKKDEEKEEK